MTKTTSSVDSVRGLSTVKKELRKLSFVLTNILKKFMASDLYFAEKINQEK